MAVEEKEKQEQTAAQTGYTSPWQTQLNDTMGKILNQEKFSYDLNGDALWKTYKDNYTTQGKMAMMDTMGQAQAMTGGYGNSYAQGVGQQAYQGYMKGLTDKIPELYELAWNQHNQKNQDLLNQYSVLSAQDQIGYGMYRDTVADSQWQKEFDESMRRYNFENKLGEFAPVASAGGGEEKKATSKTAPTGTSVAEVYAQMKQSGASNRELDNYLTASISEGRISQKNATELRNTRW